MNDGTVNPMWVRDPERPVRKARPAIGLALPISFFILTKKRCNSLVWNATEPAVHAGAFAFIAGREFSRADSPQSRTNETGVVPCSQFRHASAARSIYVQNNAASPKSRAGC